MKQIVKQQLILAAQMLSDNISAFCYYYIKVPLLFSTGIKRWILTTIASNKELLFGAVFI